MSEPVEAAPPENTGVMSSPADQEISEGISENDAIFEEPKTQKKSEIFLEGDQIPYLCEHLQGKDVNVPVSNFVSFSDPLSDEYLEFVARTGRPLFDWSVLQSFLTWKIERVMVEMEQAAPFDSRSAVPNTDRSNARQYIERILFASQSLPGVPFTIQRICELLVQPRKHYKRADKFYRALEKNVTVVTTVDKEGRRETDRQPEQETQETVETSEAISTTDNATTNCSTPERTTHNHTPP